MTFYDLTRSIQDTIIQTQKASHRHKAEWKASLQGQVAKAIQDNVINLADGEALLQNVGCYGPKGRAALSGFQAHAATIQLASK